MNNQVEKKFVVVAEGNLKFHCTLGRIVGFECSTSIGGFEFKFKVRDRRNLTLSCKEVLDGSIPEVNFEIFVMRGPTEFGNNPKGYMLRALNRTRTYLAWNLGNHPEDWNIVIRVLKERNLFPDFTLDRPIGRFKNDIKLRVGQQLFHANKQLLSTLSPYFDRLFNGSFVEANQDLIETGETDPELYHEFLLALTAPMLLKEDVLSNRENIFGMMRLAQYYQVDRMIEQCERHLRMCREIPFGGPKIDTGYDLDPGRASARLSCCAGFLLMIQKMLPFWRLEHK